jgi:hypothetical protein
VLGELRALEEKLLQPDIRRNREAVALLLADEFREFGSSGRVYTKSEILDLLETESSFRSELTEFRATALKKDVVLVTYRLSRQTMSLSTLRSSLWVHRDGRWQMLFHQGTLVAP